MLTLYRVLAFLVWFGVMFAICTVIIAVALVGILLAVVYGVGSPSRTPASCLRSLGVNVREGIERIQALRPTYR